MQDIDRIYSEHMADLTSSWSVGEFGVLAEFHHTLAAGNLIGANTVAAPGGAMRIRPVPGTRVLAYETPSPNPRLWNHGVAFCLRENEALMDQRSGVTELGPDHGAIYAASRSETLFDLGLGRRSVNFCVRTADPALIERLRSVEGDSLLKHPELNAEIVAASPTRVVESQLARIEISNPIPPPDGESPPGPHTHLMPGLMRRGRTHDANIPIPSGFLACLTLYPAHAARDAEGRERPFDANRHAVFQRLLERHGDPDYVAAKQGNGPLHSRREKLGRLIAARQSALASGIQD